MNSTWGVYGVCGRLPGGKETTASDRSATSFFVRWRVDGKARRRTLRTRAYAKTFQSLLISAKVSGWQADERGWPIDPRDALLSTVEVAAAPGPPAVASPSFESYVNDTWWPNLRGGMEDKDRLRHRRNADVAVQLLRYLDGDFRIVSGETAAGASILGCDLDADDIKSALVRRKSINGRTAAVNARLLRQALLQDATTVEFVPKLERALPATVRDFFITLSMIVKAGVASGKFCGDPLSGASAYAPKPRQSKLSQRLVPTVDELFDVADAIATLGPVGRDGRPAGARFRSLILCAGTLGPRPGELAAHRPEWIEWEDGVPSKVRFHQTEAAVYGHELANDETGRRSKKLKHRDEDEFRRVPLISDVEDSLREHFDRGYVLDDRTWASPSGTAHLDWGNIRDTYLRAAFGLVFAGTEKAALADAPAGLLRKTAITYWMENGIPEQKAAEWAGHTSDVQRVYYTGRSSSDYGREVSLLEKGASRQSR